MRILGAGAGGTVTAEFEPVEAALLTQLASQVSEVLTEKPETADATDPALARLLPNAYTDDAEANEEFRRFTASELTDQKVQNAQRLIVDVAGALLADAPTKIVLDPLSTGAWLRVLTDIRLVVASRLGITEEGEPGDDRDEDEIFLLSDVYEWLGWVQESLVNAIDS